MGQDSKIGCSARELAAILNSTKKVGPLVGRVIANLGLVQYEQRRAKSGYLLNRWWDDATAPHAVVDMRSIAAMIQSGKMLEVTEMGKKGLELLCKALKVEPPKKERCPCCGQLIKVRHNQYGKRNGGETLTEETCHD